MQSVATVLQLTKLNNKQQLELSYINKPVVSKYHRVNVLVRECSDLINPKFKNWYCRIFYKLSNEVVLRLASIARADGQNKQKLFSYLLKKATTNA